MTGPDQDQPDHNQPGDNDPAADAGRRALARETTEVKKSPLAFRDVSPHDAGGEAPEREGKEKRPGAAPILAQNHYTGMPRGFWRRVDFILRHPHTIMNAIQRDTDLRAISTTFLAASIVMAMIYGAVMGATNLLQGAEMERQHAYFLIGIVALKVPALFLLTLLIVLPPIYVSNAFVGARFTFGQILALLLGSTAITLTILASMASVAFFFALTTSTYDFIKLLHVLFFAYAAMMGVNFLVVCLRLIPGPTAARTPARLLFVWLLLYIFVGTQLAWVLRPFIASPTEPFQVFRPKSGNIYESILQSINKATGAEKK